VNFVRLQIKEMLLLATEHEVSVHPFLLHKCNAHFEFHNDFFHRDWNAVRWDRFQVSLTKSTVSRTTLTFKLIFRVAMQCVHQSLWYFLGKKWNFYCHITLLRFPSNNKWANLLSHKIDASLFLHKKKQEIRLASAERERSDVQDQQPSLT